MGQRSFVLDKLLADIKSKESAEWRGQRKGGYYRKNRKNKESKSETTKKNEVVIWYWEVWLNCWGRKITLLSESHRPRAGFDLKGK